LKSREAEVLRQQVLAQREEMREHQQRSGQHAFGALLLGFIIGRR
jgi:hypothetical protein